MACWSCVWPSGVAAWAMREMMLSPKMACGLKAVAVRTMAACSMRAAARVVVPMSMAMTGASWSGSGDACQWVAMAPVVGRRALSGMSMMPVALTRVVWQALASVRKAPARTREPVTLKTPWTRVMRQAPQSPLPPQRRFQRWRVSCGVAMGWPVRAMV